MDNEIVAVACGACLEVRAAHHIPDFCGCGARHDLGHPLALITLELGVTTSGGALELAPRYVCDFVGDAWTAEGRERVEAMFGAHEARPPRSGERTACPERGSSGRRNA